MAQVTSVPTATTTSPPSQCWPTSRAGASTTASSAATPVTRDGVSRYHLDKLVDAGLLSASYARPEGHSGPGVGRPAKWYQRADDELSVTLPPPAYRLAAELLARTLDVADSSAGLRHRLEQIAAEVGRELPRSRPAPATPRLHAT